MKFQSSTGLAQHSAKHCNAHMSYNTSWLFPCSLLKGISLEFQLFFAGARTKFERRDILNVCFDHHVGLPPQTQRVKE